MANQLTGFYMAQIFTERYFWINRPSLQLHIINELLRYESRIWKYNFVISTFNYCRLMSEARVAGCKGKLFCRNTPGELLPPMLVYKGKFIYDDSFDELKV